MVCCQATRYAKTGSPAGMWRIPGRNVDGDIDIIAEIDAGLQVAVVEDVSVQVGFDPHTFVRGSLHVAGVVHQAGVELEGVAAGSLVGGDGADFLITLIQGGVDVIQALARILVLLALAHVPHLPVPEVDAGGPVEVVGDAALDIGQHAEHLAAQAIIVDGAVEIVRLSLRDSLVGPKVVVLQGLGAVEAPEVVHRIVHIGDGGIHAHIGNQILGVISQIEAGLALRKVGGFPADLMDGIRIGGAVTVVIDVAEGAVLETVVDRIGGARKDAHAPAGLHFLFLLLGGEERYGCHEGEGRQDKLFHGLLLFSVCKDSNSFRIFVFARLS